MKISILVLAAILSTCASADVGSLISSIQQLQKDIENTSSTVEGFDSSQGLNGVLGIQTSEAAIESDLDDVNTAVNDLNQLNSDDISQINDAVESVTTAAIEFLSNLESKSDEIIEVGDRSKQTIQTELNDLSNKTFALESTFYKKIPCSALDDIAQNFAKINGGFAVVISKYGSRSRNPPNPPSDCDLTITGSFTLAQGSNFPIPTLTRTTTGGVGIVTVTANSGESSQTDAGAGEGDVVTVTVDAASCTEDVVLVTDIVTPTDSLITSPTSSLELSTSSISSQFYSIKTVTFTSEGTEYITVTYCPLTESTFACTETKTPPSSSTPPITKTVTRSHSPKTRTSTTTLTMASSIAELTGNATTSGLVPVASNVANGVKAGTVGFIIAGLFGFLV